MNNSKMEWLAYAKTASPLDGRASAADEKGQAFVIEWKRVDILSPHLAAFKKDLSDLAAEKLSESELAFLKANPKAASSELFLRACKPLLDNGAENADWHAVQETIKASVKQFYLANLSKFGPDIIKPLLNDVYFCATARKPDEKEPYRLSLIFHHSGPPFRRCEGDQFLHEGRQPKRGSAEYSHGDGLQNPPSNKENFPFLPTDRFGCFGNVRCHGL